MLTHEPRSRWSAAGHPATSAGVLALVNAVIRTDQDGWGSAVVLGLFAAAALLLAALVRIESRASAPLAPLRLFRTHSLSSANGAQLLLGASFI